MTVENGNKLDGLADSYKFAEMRKRLAEGDRQSQQYDNQMRLIDEEQSSLATEVDGNGESTPEVEIGTKASFQDFCDLVREQFDRIFPPRKQK